MADYSATVAGDSGFSLRSPVRLNPIGTSIVRLVGVEDATVMVRGLDCLDVRPQRCCSRQVSSGVSC